MCQLLGFSALNKTDFCFSFSGFCKRGGETDIHSHGWGLCFYEGRGLRTFLDPMPSSTSPIAKLLVDLKIKTHTMISHIRMATSGPVCLENVHPFTR